MINALIRMLQLAALVIHQHIVRTLANSTAFQQVAWHGTEAAKKGGQGWGRGIEEHSSVSKSELQGYGAHDAAQAVRVLQRGGR